MSIDYRTYVGPFIRATYHNVETDKIGATCPNEKCIQYKKETSLTFCGSCGTVNKKIVICKQNKRSAYFYRIMDAADMTDDLYCTDSYSNDCVDFVFANHDVPNIIRETSFSHRGKVGIFLMQDQMDIEGEKKAFAKFYNAQIQILSKHYDSVSVDWGIVTVAS